MNNELSESLLRSPSVFLLNRNESVNVDLVSFTIAVCNLVKKCAPTLITEDLSASSNIQERTQELYQGLITKRKFFGESSDPNIIDIERSFSEPEYDAVRPFIINLVNSFRLVDEKIKIVHLDFGIYIERGGSFSNDEWLSFMFKFRDVVSQRNMKFGTFEEVEEIMGTMDYQCPECFSDI